MDQRKCLSLGGIDDVKLCGVCFYAAMLSGVGIIFGSDLIAMVLRWSVVCYILSVYNTNASVLCLSKSELKAAT